MKWWQAALVIVGVLVLWNLSVWAYNSIADGQKAQKELAELKTEMSSNTTNNSGDSVQPAVSPQPEASQQVAAVPTTQEVKNLLGIDVEQVGTEPAAWTWRGRPASINVVCDPGFVFTLDTDNGVIVLQGDGKTRKIYAGTFRWAPSYPEGAHGIFLNEQSFGRQQVPSFEVRFEK